MRLYVVTVHIMTVNIVTSYVVMINMTEHTVRVYVMTLCIVT